MKPLSLTLALITTLQGQQPNAAGMLEVSPEVAVNAANEFTPYHDSLADIADRPSLPIWTVVQVKDGEHAGKVGTVCGGSGTTLRIDIGDGNPDFEVDASNVTKL
jgi:hypothetical protein